MQIIFKNFITTLRRYKTSSLLNIIGLAVAFVSLYIILVQVNYDFTYNQKIKDSERVYRLEMPYWDDNGMYMSQLNRPIPERIISSVSQIEYGGTIYLNGQIANFTIDRDGMKHEYTLRVSMMSTPIIEIWGFEAVSGTFADFDKPNAVILSQSSAKRLNLSVGDFINEVEPQQVGQQPNSYEVIAIYKDLAKNIDGSDVELFANIGKVNLEDQQEWSYPYYLKLTSTNDTASFYSQLKTVMEAQIAESGTEPNSEEYARAIRLSKFRLNPVTSTYYTQDVGSAPGKVGNKTTTFTLLAIAILIVAIALINFINFFFALVPIRIKSVNTHKIFGSPVSQIRFSFIFEALGLVVVALLAAWLLVVIVKSSTIANLISAPIALSLNLSIVAITILAAIIIALVGSIYPSFYITSFPAAMVIKGSFSSSKSGQHLRYSLIGLQFVISISLIICASLIKLQHSYMMNFDMGFNKENLLTVRIPNSISGNLTSRDAFTDKLLQSAKIKDAAWAAGRMVAESRMGWGRDFKGKNIQFQCYPVSWNFLRFMGIEVTEGRDFTAADEIKEDGTIIFNQKAKQNFGLTLEDKVFGHMSNVSIAGFCNDFNFRPLQYGVSEFAFYIFGKNPWSLPGFLYIRTEAGANVSDVMNYTRNCITEFAPEINASKIDINFFDEDLQLNYQKEQRLTALITIFTIISVIISLMGVFGLVMFETQYRHKEIGIRRVHGASIGEILAMFNSKFVRIVLICFVIAAPISYYIIDQWLADFAYRTPIHWWVFALSLVIILAITVSTVTIRSLRAATDDPAKSIKTE